MSAHIEIPVEIPASLVQPGRVRRMVLLSSYLVGLLAINSLLPGSRLVATSATGPIDRVEEDWELVVADPDASRLGPQVTTTMRPMDAPHAPTFAFHLNHGEPSDVGLSVDAIVLDSHSRTVLHSPGPRGAMNTPGESVAWTQRLQVLDGRLCYEVREGSSSTWGRFGPGEGLDLERPTPLADLSGYDARASSADSGAGWLGERVGSLTLKSVRYYSHGLLVRVDAAPRPSRLPRG